MTVIYPGYSVCIYTFYDLWRFYFLNSAETHASKSLGDQSTLHRYVRR